MQSDRDSPAAEIPVRKTVVGILLALCASHMVNDTLQALLPSIYPVLKASFGLTFAQIGLITLSSATVLVDLSMNPCTCLLYTSRCV